MTWRAEFPHDKYIQRDIQSEGNLKRNWNTAARQSQHEHLRWLFGILLEDFPEAHAQLLTGVRSITKLHLCSPVAQDAS
jgi:hypothetical protein